MRRLRQRNEELDRIFGTPKELEHRHGVYSMSTRGTLQNDDPQKYCTMVGVGLSYNLTLKP